MKASPWALFAHHLRQTVHSNERLRSSQLLQPQPLATPIAPVGSASSATAVPEESLPVSLPPSYGLAAVPPLLDLDLPAPLVHQLPPSTPSAPLLFHPL